MQKSIKDGFTAEKCVFQGVGGYMLKQWHNGFMLCSQFIPRERLVEFCSAAGIDKSKIMFKG